jgi:hypothetical protein
MSDGREPQERHLRVVPPPSGDAEPEHAPVAQSQPDTEYELFDVSGDGRPDAVVARSSQTFDIDGDGRMDTVENVQTVAIDFDGDGRPEVLQTTTTVGMDVDGDGRAESVEVTRVTKVRDRSGAFVPVEVINVDETMVPKADGGPTTTEVSVRP